MRSRTAFVTLLAIGALITYGIAMRTREGPRRGDLPARPEVERPLVAMAPDGAPSPLTEEGDGPASLPAPSVDKTPKPAASPRYQDALIQGVPFIRQKPDFCGEACAAMYLRHLGQPVDQDYVFDQSGLDPLEARGCYTRELAAALRHIGFRIGPVWHKAPTARLAESLESLWKALHADLQLGIASIVCMYFDGRRDTTEHFRLVLGYDSRRDEVLFHDPAIDRGAYLRMKRADFLSLWPLRYDAREQTVIRLRLEAGELRPGRASEAFTPADYAQHIMKLKRKIPGNQFTVVVQPPFVVIGDESSERVRQHAERTVKWAVDRLKARFFDKDPLEILDIWLFKDEESYRKHCKAIFHSEPSTPFGYFSDADGALVMNIATGGGTLVHEMVHPFVAADFPGCPAWLNEGLGSLYEQCGDVDGRIHGYTNWRLPGLQAAIRNKKVPPFETLCSTTERQFYREDRGTNYAQARYLCYYLQQHNLLETFYRRFRANRETDPTGYQTLQEVLGRPDMDEFQKQWEAFVLKLRFP